MSDLRIASRRSPLALAQAAQVAEKVAEIHPHMTVSILGVTTSGDRDRRSPVTTLTEVGAFVRAVQQTVMDGEADLAVHSSKDIPIEGPDGLVTTYPLRDQPWDALCGHDLKSLPRGARVGTGSPRRAAQMRRLCPDVEMADIRGNVDTRLRKLHSGEYEAVVLAAAGLARLGRQAEAGCLFSVDQMVPAPGQGALAVEARAGTEAAELARSLEDVATRLAVEAERAVLAGVRAGCRSALGALGRVEDDVIRLWGFVEDERGPRSGMAEGDEPEQAARKLREELGL